MTMKVASPCRGCRRLITTGPRCAACQKTENARHFNPAYNDRQYREKRAKAIYDHVRQAGWNCPGWGSQGPHPSRDLTADHPVALRNGGDHDQPFRVLCRSCNGRKGAR